MDFEKNSSFHLQLEEQDDTQDQTWFETWLASLCCIENLQGFADLEKGNVLDCQVQQIS